MKQLLGSKVQIVKDRYEVLLSYPTAQSSIRIMDGTTEKHKAQIIEDKVPVDPQTDINDPMANAFNAYSPSGTVSSANYYYVNYGRKEDFETLKKQPNVVLANAIVVIRYGKIFRGLKVQNAEKEGVKGVILYSDPADDGESKGQVYPNGVYRPETSMQRGSVEYLNIQPGDPTTPNGPSIPGTRDRIARSEAKNIPQNTLVQPINAKDATEFMKEMKGNQVPEDWKGALKGITYNFGSSGNAVTFELKVENTESLKIIENVFGIVKGDVEPDRMVMLGNHRDAWIYGSVDPHSGTIAMIEVMRSVGKLLQNNWKPRRSLVFASWDAEEHGLIGSTEYVENYANLLKKELVAYLNVDNNNGDQFVVSASPSLLSIIREEAADIDYGVNKTTLAQAWTTTPRYVGSGSDDSPFFHHLGVSTISMGFKNAEIGAPGVYHSLYETEYYYSKLIDKDFDVALATAQIWGMVSLRLVGDDILPFNLTEQASALSSYYKSLFTNEVVKSYNETLNADDKKTFNDALTQTSSFLSSITKLSAETMVEAKTLLNIGRQSKNYESRARAVNDRFMNVERAMTNQNGLPGRQWYKHVICAPNSETGYGFEVFPALMDSIRAKDLKSVLIAIDQINNAFKNVVVGLTQWQ
jgi:N-acetylated-alpha-linked acidic dipeptidase